MYQLEKVDTEKIFQLNIFSKVDNRDIFVRFDFTKVDILSRFTSFSFSKVYTFPKSLSDSTVARLFRTNLGSVVNSLFSNVPLYQLEKVDTEKIFQLNIFSKVDTFTPLQILARQNINTRGLHSYVA